MLLEMENKSHYNVHVFVFDNLPGKNASDVNEMLFYKAEYDV